MEEAKLFERQVTSCPGTSETPTRPFFMDFIGERKQTGKEVNRG